ncbi:MAG TPA: hypothetical protein VME17_12410 [Bryobacteraceae bacterium]|nr:hypothetical protein [Bryobacteraceae bacterium]
MSLRGLVLSIAGLLGCATALSAQNIPVFPSCLAFEGISGGSTGCAVGSSFSYDFGALFDFDAIAAAINGSGISFTYSFSVTSGALPPGISVTPSGLISGTFTQSGSYNFSVSLSWTLSDPALNFSYSFSYPFPFAMVVSGYSGAQVTVDPSNLNFSLTQAAAPVMQSVTLTNHGGQAAQFSASAATSSGGNWLSLSSGSGSVGAYSSQALSVTADPASLQPGTYSGTITVSIAGAQPITISVLAVVTGSQPNLALSQTGLFFEAVSGGSASSPQTIQVLNEGAGTLSYSASAFTFSGGNWLSVSSSSGSASASSPGAVTVSVNITGLQAGTYYGKVTFAASGAADSPQFASVVLNLVSPANSPGGALSPSGLIFVGSVSGMNPAAQTVTISNPSPDALTYLATPFSNGNVSWLNASPTSGTVSAGQPAMMSVQPMLQGLTAGVYIGDLSVAFVSTSTTSTAASQVLHIEVLLIVLPAGETSSSIRPGPQPHATTCTPTQLLPVFTLLGTGFSSTVGWPTAIEVTVVDDCGNPLLSGAGSVTVTFSSGDPALSLTSIGNGSWTGTWNAANAATGVTITAQAQELKPALAGSASIGGTLASNAGVPSVSTGGIVSAANFVANQPLAPGAFGAIFGSNLAQSLAGSNQFPLSTSLGGTSVVLNGEQLPLLFASTGQINAIIPYDVPVNSTQQLIVERGAAISIPQPVVIAPAVPAVFTQNGAGTGAALYNVYQSNGTPLPNNSAVTAGDVIVLYASGLGAVNPPVAAGVQAPVATLSNTVNPVTAMIGGQSAKVEFAGLAPGFASLYQVNIVVPSGVASGTAAATLSVSGQQSAPVMITVQ